MSSLLSTLFESDRRDSTYLEKYVRIILRSVIWLTKVSAKERRRAALVSCESMAQKVLINTYIFKGQ